MDRHILSDFTTVADPTPLGLTATRIEDPAWAAVPRLHLGFSAVIVGALSLAAWAAIWVVVAMAMR